jgi:uncharacterized protein (DUF58 family)
LQQLSNLSGPPTEFDGHRPYMPGDDTRWIDWNLFARLEELYVKYFQVEEEVEVLIMLDVSRSMTAAGSRKHSVASAAAAAVAYLAFLSSHPVTFVRYAEKALDSKGPFRNLQTFPEVTRFLLAKGEGGSTDLRRSLLPYLLHRRRPVTVVILSDCFQCEPLEKVVRTVRGIEERRVVLLRMIEPEDLQPSLRGNIQVDDIEGGGSCSLISDRTLEGQMHRRIDRHFLTLEAHLKQSGADILGFPVERPFEEAFFETLLTTLPPAVKVS